MKTKFVNFWDNNPFAVRVKSLNYVNLAVYAVLILISYQFLYPLLRMISMAMMDSDDIINPTVNWVPTALSFENMRVAWRVLDPSTTLTNSIWFSGLLAFCSTLVAATTGYALARFEFPLKKFWFFMIIVSFVLPMPILLIPRTMMAFSIQEMEIFGRQIQMFGTIRPQVVMAIGGQGVFSAILILIFYNFTKMIPFALDEAAAIDGASSLQTFYHVILKLSVTTLLVVFLFAFVWNWNETIVTGTFVRDGLALIPRRLGMFESEFSHLMDTTDGMGAGLEEMRINEAFRMSGTLIAIFPLFVLYLVVQRQFIKGIENTGLTGL